ncbi:MAG: Holliday junction branch migration protein RuvA [Actinomycetota bacterium]
MIAMLRGRLAETAGDGAILDVGGVGYRVYLPTGALARLPGRGEPVTLHVHTYVREDTLALYGFLSPEERDVFEVLLGVTRVGPKVALAVLSVHGPEALRRAVATGDADALALVPGIGKKGAARLVLELKDKLGEGDLEGPAAGTTELRAAISEVRSALSSLGYSPSEVKESLEALPALDGETSPEEMLRLALRNLAGRR